jgi:hypothetical protein
MTAYALLTSLRMAVARGQWELARQLATVAIDCGLADVLLELTDPTTPAAPYGWAYAG